MNSNGSINVNSLTQFTIREFDAIAISYPDVVTEVYAYKTGGISGSTVATITVIYSDSTKNQINSVVKT